MCIYHDTSVKRILGMLLKLFEADMLAVALMLPHIFLRSRYDVS